MGSGQSRRFPDRLGSRPFGRKRPGGWTPPAPRLQGLLVILVLAALVLWDSGARASEGNQPAEAKILRATLANGLRVVIVRNTLAPVVTTVVNYLAGSNEAPEGFPGMAHAQEHMMFRGSPGLSTGQLARITAAMGGRFGAETQEAVTRYFFTMPAKDLEVALNIEAVRMRGVLNDEKLWDRERRAMEQEVARNFSSPRYVFYTRVLAALFRGTPYAHDALGTVPSLQKTTGAMLKEFYRAWYVPNNAILVVVGDVEPARALDQVKSLFEDIPSKELPARTGIRLQPVTPTTFDLVTDLAYGLVALAFRMPGYDSPDYAAGQVLAKVLNNQRGDLVGLVAKGRALSAAFGLDTMLKAGLGFAAAGFPKGGDSRALLKTIRQIFSDYVRKGFPDDLVAAAKRYAMADLELQKNSVSGLAMAWSRALAVEGRQSPEDLVKAIDRVSVEDVNRVARQYLDLDRAITAVLTPRASGAPVAAKGGGGCAALVPEHNPGVKLPVWAGEALTRLSIPRSGLNPTVTTLPNGLKLIMQPVSISNTVSLLGHVKNNPDLETPPGKEGVGDVLNRLFSYGSTSLDRVAFQKALDGIGAYASAGTMFSLKVLAEDFERGAELLADNQLRPALPKNAFRIVRRQMAQTLAGRLDSPGFLAERALKIGLFPQKDPALRQATPETVSALTLEDVRSYYKKVFRPDLTTVVVIGKIEPDKARRIIEKHFGGWQAQGPKPETSLPPVPPNGPSTTSVPNITRVQDKVTLAQTLGLNRSHPDYYALKLGNHVLGGGFYATRLYQDLREKTGLVYSVSSFFEIGKTRSVYVVNYACDPSNTSKVRATVDRNLLDLQTTLVGDEELRQAKAMLLREIPNSESSITTIVHGFIRRTERGLPLDEPVRAARRYLDLTATQIREAFARWVRPGDLVQVVHGPQR